MLRFSFFGIPVIIHWVFWVTMALLGGAVSALTPEAMQRVLAWVVAGFLSIFIHELGHALAMHHFGARQVHIVLHSFGGYAICERQFGRKESFVVSGAGPFVQILAGVAMWAALDAAQPQGLMLSFMRSFVRVSIAWAILNLFPIIPLDGGRLMEALLGPRKLKIALTISLVCAVGFGILAFFMGQIFIAVFFGMFAFGNWKQLRGEPPTLMP